MGFVFYDTETTGISTSFDQIVQFAAVHTDADLNIVDRFEIRSRLLPFVIPSPYALRVTKMSIERLQDQSLPSHNEMVNTIIGKFTEWSPAIFLGYNSLSFDEELLRQSLYQNLHNPYLTSRNKSGRGDVMRLVQAVADFNPNCLRIPTKEDGKRLFKLDQVAPLNDFDHRNAHDALSDVEATIHICRLVRDRAPEQWNQFLRFTQKVATSHFLDEEEPFMLSESYFGIGKHTPVHRIAVDDQNPNLSYCFDLGQDLNSFRNLTDAQLQARLATSPKPIRKVKSNAAPILTPLDEVPEHILGDISIDELRDRAFVLRSDEALMTRITLALKALAVEYPPSEHAEKTLYEGFATKHDEVLMQQFHCLPWEQRHKLCAQFEKPALQFFAKRLIYEHAPRSLTLKDRFIIEEYIHNRITCLDKDSGWGTLHKALAECLELVGSETGESLEIVQGFLAHLKERLLA